MHLDGKDKGHVQQGEKADETAFARKRKMGIVQLHPPLIYGAELHPINGRRRRKLRDR